MDKIVNFRMFLAAVAVVFVLTSCEKAPQAEIDAAVQAVDSAKLAQADVYATNQFNALQDSLNSVLAKVEEQKAKTFPSFGSIKEELNGVSLLAVQTIATAEANKAQAKEELLAAVQELKDLLENDKNLLASAPKGKGGAAVLEEIKQEMDVLEASLNEVTATIENANFIEYKGKVGALKTKAEAINTELTEAFAKVGKKA
jgi:chromosome segregation ATPase